MRIVANPAMVIYLMGQQNKQSEVGRMGQEKTWLSE